MRSSGFDRMDVSTSLPDDPKFRVLARRHPELLAAGGWVYVGLLATSWREGQRLTLEEGWPALLPFDPAIVDALREAHLVDDELRIPEHAWSEWYLVASTRRQLGRDRQHRADVNRGRVRPDELDEVDVPSPGPPSSSVSTGSAQAVQESQAGPASDLAPVHRWTNGGPNGTGTTTKVPSEGHCRDCGGWLTDQEACRVGPGFIEHAEHPQQRTEAKARPVAKPNGRGEPVNGTTRKRPTKVTPADVPALVQVPK
jgi:hypothetical protein